VPLQVQLVAADRPVWSGEATIVIARTISGDIGIMPGHEPVLGELASGVVLARTTDGGVVTAAVHGGFISVENDIVSLLAEQAELADEIDVESARREVERLSGGVPEDTELSAAQLRAETRLRAAEAHIG
jgi:F-type H+-transporting ATPase subunit epsilon